MATASSSKAIKRLPLRQALESLQSGEGASTFPPSVKSISMRYIQKNAGSGPKEFLQTIAPRIAYANPTIRFHVEHILDPRSKSKDPSDIKKLSLIVWENKIKPRQELVIEIDGRDTERIDVSDLSGSKIFQRLWATANGQALPVDTIASSSPSTSTPEASTLGGQLPVDSIPQTTERAQTI